MTHICSICFYEGKGRKVKRGSGKMEWGLWLTLLFPGPIYSAWRRVGLKRLCPQCGIDTMVSLKSDEGYVIQRKLDAELGLIPKKDIAPPPQPKPAPKNDGEAPKKMVIDPDQF